MTGKTKYLAYPPERDIIFVLGAGASYPDGVPLQKHILPMILSNDEIRDSEVGRPVIEFITDNFAYNDKEGAYPYLEAVFGFLDYFIQNNESLSSKYSYTYLRIIKESLIKLIHHIVNSQTDKESTVYKNFWQMVNGRTSNYSIISLNYDTMLEEAFQKHVAQFGYLDYCIHLMNYDRSDEIEQFNYWIDPRSPVSIDGNENPVSIKLIKLHGSLNWKYCTCCNQTLRTTWDREIDLTKGKFTGYTYPDKEKYEYVCPQDGTDFETLIMMPSYVKPLHHPVISQLLSESAREIRATKKIVFVGYSLSDADLHIRALFKKHLTEDVKVTVINTRETEAFQLKYLSLTKNVQFFTCSFEEMIGDENLTNTIFA
jgi:NAD-dependent SIR2 family protein deacetylase